VEFQLLTIREQLLIAKAQHKGQNEFFCDGANIENKGCNTLKE
jgi:hypothetical protein